MPKFILTIGLRFSSIEILTTNPMKKIKKYKNHGLDILWYNIRMIKD